MNLTCKMLFIYTILYNHGGKKVEHIKKSFDVYIHTAVGWLYNCADNDQ